MEIMHSKFLKLQTALLSVLLLFSVLLPPDGLSRGRHHQRSGRAGYCYAGRP